MYCDGADFTLRRVIVLNGILSNLVLSVLFIKMTGNVNTRLQL